MSTEPSEPIDLWRSSSARVVESGDAGGFYCEHAFYAASQAFLATNDPVLRADVPLVGFLHCPKDRWTEQADAVVDQAARHRDTVAILVAALQALYGPLASASLDNHQPMEVLLTGYGEWGTVKNNPTGDLVRHAENLTAIRTAFCGDIAIRPLFLAVDDTAIDGGAASIQHAIARSRPHVVISMGVHNGAGWLVETNATDRNLVDNGRGGFTRQPDLAARTRLPVNRTLARALQARHVVG